MNRPRKHDKHLPRGVYLRHGAYYYVQKGKWLPLGKDLRTALGAYAALREAPKGGMGDLIDAATPHILHGVARNTNIQYRQAILRLKKALVEFSPEELKSKHVAQLKLGWAKRPAMANRCLSVLRKILDYAVENQIIDSNPSVGIRAHKQGRRTRLLTIGEYQAIYAKANPRLQIIMDLCIRTGQRIGDVLKIRRADLLEEGIRFQQQKTGAKGIVPWTPELREVVDRAKRLHGNLKALTLLHDRTGKAPTYGTTRAAWVHARTAAAVSDARIHDLRAFAATWAKKQGKNPTALLMHASPSQTVRYLREKEELTVEGPSFGHLIDSSK